MTRTRDCDNQTPDYFGDACVGDSSESQTGTCNTDPCPGIELPLTIDVKFL